MYTASGVALKAAFDYFDADSSGFIDRSELSVMLRKLGFGWQGGGVFTAADTNRDGRVSFDEFLALFAAGPPPLPSAPASHASAPEDPPRRSKRRAVG